MVWRALTRGFLSGVGSSYGRGFVGRMTKRFGGRKRAPYTTRRGRVMRGRFSRRRAPRGTYRKEVHSQMALDLAAAAVLHDTAPPVPFNLCDIDQGDNDNNRTGNNIVITKLHGRLFFNWHSSEVTVLTTGVRVIICHFPNRITTSSAPVLAQMLTDPSKGMVSQYIRKRDISGDDVFKIVYDKTFFLHKYPSAVANALWSHGANHRLLHINLKPKTRCTYVGATGTSLGAGMYFLWMFTGTGLTSDIQVTGQIRTWWKDV